MKRTEAFVVQVAFAGITRSHTEELVELFSDGTIRCPGQRTSGYWEMTDAHGAITLIWDRGVPEFFALKNGKLLSNRGLFKFFRGTLAELWQWSQRIGFNFRDRSKMTAPVVRRPAAAPMREDVPDFAFQSKGSITAIILNWKRPANVAAQIIPVLQKDPQVAEIIIVDNKPTHGTKFLGAKVSVMETSRDFGLDSRFAAALLARTEYVLIQDDDLIVPAETVKFLLQAARREPDRLHCCFGRNPTAANAYAMEVNRQSGEVAIALTRVLVTRREHCSLFFAAREFPAIQQARARFQDFGSHPENGEDIIFSYSVSNKFAKLHRTYALTLVELPSGNVGLSEHNTSGFRAHRTEIMRAAQQYAQPPQTGLR